MDVTGVVVGCSGDDDIEGRGGGWLVSVAGSSTVQVGRRRKSPLDRRLRRCAGENTGRSDETEAQQPPLSCKAGDGMPCLVGDWTLTVS